MKKNDYKVYAKTNNESNQTINCVTGNFTAKVLDIEVAERLNQLPENDRNVNHNIVAFGKIKKWGKVQNVYQPNNCNTWYFLDNISND